jgi:hypothetical protein
MRRGALDEGSRLRARFILCSINVEPLRRCTDEVTLAGRVARSRGYARGRKLIIAAGRRDRSR